MNVFMQAVKSPAGMLITTAHDIILETVNLLDHLQKEDYQKAGESCVNILNRISHH